MAEVLRPGVACGILGLIHSSAHVLQEYPLLPANVIPEAVVYKIANSNTATRQTAL